MEQTGCQRRGGIVVAARSSMPRPVWKRAITFALVEISVRAGSSERPDRR